MKTFTGIVVANKMNKTVTVLVNRQKAHPMYHKRVIVSKKYHVEDSLGVKVGDRVKFIETRPLSKTKKWQIKEVIK
jgi:small subunit ribosomal protein S17